MTTTYLTLSEIWTLGFEALLRELGPAGTIRFFQQYEIGRGDYTRDRRKWLSKKSVREIGKQIVKERRKSKEYLQASVKTEAPINRTIGVRSLHDFIYS